MRTKCFVGTALFAVVVLSGCEPGTISEARDQLGRGDPRTLELSLPVTADTFTIARFLTNTDTATTSSGLLGIPISAQNVSVAIGEQLEFTGLNFDAFSFGYDQMLTTSPESTTVAVLIPSPPFQASVFGAPPPGAIAFSTDNGSAVLGATIATGRIVRRITNTTGCDGTVTVTAVDSLGNSVVSFPPVFGTSGQTASDTTDASGATFVGFIQLGASVVPAGACIPASGSQVAVDVIFEPLTLASVTLTNVNEPFTDNYAALAGESRVQAVDTVVARSGSFTLSAQNRLPIALNFDVQVQGIFRNGVPITGNLLIPAAPGDGSTTTGTLVFDMTGDTIVPSQVLATVNGNASAAQATITSTVVANAVVVDAIGNLVVDRLIGTLDPAQTPELTVTAENFVSISSADFDFGDFEDAIRDATINNAEAVMAITNTSGVPLVLTDFNLSVAQLDPFTGEPRRDANGNFILETDSNGDTLKVRVADPGDTVLTIARNSVSNVTLELAPVADRIVKLALDNIDVALVAQGTAVAGDSSSSVITRSDVIEFAVDLTVGLDLTLPASGVTFQVNNLQTGAEFDPDDADDIAERVVSAGVSSLVTNGTPFALRVSVAFVEGSRGVDFDVFALADRVELTPVTVVAPTVDAAGLVTAPTSSQVSVALTGAQLRQLLGDSITTSIKITLLPGPGGGGRSAVRPTDELMLNVNAEAVIRGGSQ